MALVGELDAMIGDHLVDLAILVPFRLRVPDQDYQLKLVSNDAWNARGLCLPVVCPSWKILRVIA